jgi:Family of unknown function (DUF6065)
MPEPSPGSLYAYYRGSTRPLTQIVPADRWRAWMNATTLRYANRCLPLLMANESGWVFLNPAPFTVTWNGGDHADQLTVDYGDCGPPPDGRAVSLFGYGILTLEPPYLLRTPPGWNTLVRGPANWPKDGICALEGLVETDWACATFTMNWRLTRPGTVCFDADDPVCMVVPQRRGELEEFRPAVKPVSTDPETQAGWDAFRASRQEIHVRKFVAEYLPDAQDQRDSWEQDYFRGRAADGRPAPEHATKRRLAPFGDPD